MTASAKQVSDALKGVLASGRAHFNTRVAEMRRRSPAFDASAFAAFLRTGLDSIASSVAAVAPERTASVVIAAYDVALDLVSQGLAGPGARTDLVERVWVTLAPRYARLTAVQPVEVLGSLSNAILHVASFPSARVHDWLDTMAALAEHADSVPQLRLLGHVAAWRSGLAHFREGALRSAEALPAAVALTALGAEGGADWSSVRDALKADPWWRSPQAEREGAARIGVEVGEYTGFGGGFAQPPQVRAAPQGFFVRSMGRHNLLIADAYGAVLLPATAEEFEEAPATTRESTVALVGSRLVIAARSIDLDLPVDGLELVVNANTVAVTSPYTHAIRLFPRS